MKNNSILLKSTIVLALLIAIVPFQLTENKGQAFSNQVIQKGAVGEDVIELQSRLQYIGFYHGKIDGVFGWGTYWALRNFQEKFDLPTVDGLAGKDTKNMLVRATKYNEPFVKEQIDKGNKFTHYGGMEWDKQKAPAKKETQQKPNEKQPAAPNAKGDQPTDKNQQQPNQNAKKEAPTDQNQQSANPEGENTKEQKQPGSEKEGPKAKVQQQNEPAPAKEKETSKKPTATNTPNGFSQNDIKLLANAVYGEARGEPYIGQVAVAAVILNRINSSIFPNTVSGVIFEPGAFTAVADGQIWLTPNDQAKKAVIDALNGTDPTGEAIYYFNPATATNKWIWGRPQIKKIGKHIFCK